MILIYLFFALLFYEFLSNVKISKTNFTFHKPKKFIFFKYTVEYKGKKWSHSWTSIHIIGFNIFIKWNTN